MEAIEHAFTDPLPSELYVDTDILLSFIATSQPHHERCVGLLGRVAQEQRTTVYLSSLSWIEFGHVIMREHFRRSLSADLQQRLRLHRWEEPLVRQAYIQTLVRSLQQVLAQLAWREIDITPAIRTAALQYIGQYNLGGQDAAHLACTLYAGVSDFASLDAGFRRVDGLHLWNDRIHGSRPT